MKNHIKQLITTAITSLQQQGLLPELPISQLQIDRTRDPQHGDFSANIAMVLAKAAQRKPRDIAELIVTNLPTSPWVKEVMIAGPGFINFYLHAEAFQAVVKDIVAAGDSFGLSKVGQQQKVHVEFVSSNPNGPLHVGHGRGAAYGATLADILAAAGFAVHREYYVNDAGRQMDIVTTSVWLRYLALCGETITFPKNGYQGDYVVDIARDLQVQQGDRLQRAAAAVFADIPADESESGGDKEAHIDGLIARAKSLLGETGYRLIFKRTIDTILADIRDDLTEFGVTFQHWFSEKSLFTSGTITRAIAKLEEGGHLYQQAGATWFRSTALGDDKDRVVVRENGQPTYFASDIAYFLSKHERGFERMIMVLGADHHGYIPRLKAAMQALGIDPQRLLIPLVQLAVLYRGKERVPMSTRGGAFVTLRELREEVGNDAARFFYVWRKCEQGLDFDLELAKSKSNENPVYYIQYAHARICSVFRQLAEKELSYDPAAGLASLARLESQIEKELLSALAQYPEIVEAAALTYEPHLLAHFLRDLANCFHGYYNACQFIVTDHELRNARLALISAAQQVFKNGLTLLGVSAPTTM